MNARPPELPCSGRTARRRSLLIIAALILYLAGLGDTGTDLGALSLVAGVVCEFMFWARLFRGRREKKTIPIS